MTTTAEPRRGTVEVRSIDYVPLAERHGKLWHLGPLWFMSNAQIATLAVGIAGVSAGGNLIWSLIAIVLGTFVGTFFMAAHCSQGPQLGLPQMIQSRPQFGYIGALLVWLFAYLQYAGFNVFNTLLAADSVTTVTHQSGIGSVRLWVVIGTVAAAAAAIFGYDLIHRMEQVLAYGFLVLFGVVTIILFTLTYPSGAFSLGSFSLTPFLLQFSVVAGYQISWAIYVSDYSRYLPPEVTIRKTFYWTYGGSALGAVWIMAIGSCLAAWAKAFSGTGIPELHDVGNKFFTGFGGIVLIYAAIGVLSVTALNMYGGSLTLISALDSFKKVRPTLRMRLVMITITSVLSLVVAWAFANNGSFQEDFSSFLLLVLYFFIPWTAVNLVDYFIVRRGHYAIAEIFKPDGIYGRWGWRGIVSYLVGFCAMLPFFSTPKYTGWVAHAAKGADFSLFVGLPVAGILYWILSRSVDTATEQRLAEEQADILEREALAHERTEA
jgi:purine-cytosine permease-like protein